MLRKVGFVIGSYILCMPGWGGWVETSLNGHFSLTQPSLLRMLFFYTYSKTHAVSTEANKRQNLAFIPRFYFMADPSFTSLNSLH